MNPPMQMQEVRPSEATQQLMIRQLGHKNQTPPNAKSDNTSDASPKKLKRPGGMLYSDMREF